MPKQITTKEPKDQRQVFRASTEFVDTLDQYILQENLNKSEFIRNAIINEMQRKNPYIFNPLLHDNSFYNYVLAESATSTTYKRIIDEYNKRRIQE